MGFYLILKAFELSFIINSNSFIKIIDEVLKKREINSIN